ncbi:MAG: DUF4062 domain-containing protein [Candidatus Lustribacter sp.]|jgi:hypothetical protein
MVSSTFYDLREIRQQLASMISDELGYKALISESPLFPIEPDIAAIENCRRRVEEDVDILVLVIGRRYGSIYLESGKSITNIEYAAARAKGIPIYVFIDNQAQTLFEAWRGAVGETKRAIGSAVEDARLFEFIERIRVDDGVWTNGFTNAADITSSLRAQLAFLMKSGLDDRVALRNLDREFLTTLSYEAYRIAVERPNLWEFSLLAQVLADEVQSSATKRREHDLGLRYGPTTSIPDAQVFGWMLTRWREFQNLLANAKSIASQVEAAFGPPGTPGSVVDIVFVSRQLGKIYNGFIDWSQLVRQGHASAADLQGLIDSASGAGEECMAAIEQFPTKVREAVATAISESNGDTDRSGAHRVIKIRLGFDINTEPMHKALDDFARARGIKVEGGGV